MLEMLLLIAQGPKKLTFLYLANDVLQNSKKKGPEFNRDFRTVLAEAYKETSRFVLKFTNMPRIQCLKARFYPGIPLILKFLKFLKKYICPEMS